MPSGRRSRRRCRRWRRRSRAGLGDEDRPALADDPVALAQDQLDEPRVLLRLDGEALRLGRRRHAVQRDDTPLRLRDDLLGDDDDVAGLDAGAALGGLEDQRREVIAFADLGNTGEGDDADFGHVLTPAWAGLKPSPYQPLASLR